MSARARRRAALRGATALATLVAGAGAVATLGDAEAQRTDPRRPSVFVVGPPPGAAPMQRVDARRSGATMTSLPTGPLRVAWRKPTGLTLDQAALSGGDGALAVVSVRGDVTFLDEAGDERATVKVGAAHAGPAAMTSDGTVVYTTSAGDVIGVRRAGAATPTAARIRFTTRIGGDRNVKAAPLSLDDGGVVVATMTDLVMLDSEGLVRSRATLPEPPDAPLLAAGDKVIAVTRTGAVFGWTPGREPVRLGSFGAPVDGGAVLLDGTRLVAVIEGNHLAEVDVSRGGRTTRSIAAQGLYLGPPASRPARAGAAATTLLSYTHTHEIVVTLDAAGQELFRAPVASYSPTPLPDGGMAPLVAPPHIGPLVDGRGAIAFAATDGHVGVVGPDGAIDTLDEVLCAKGARSGVVGLTPFGNGAFAVTCDGGTVVRVTGPLPSSKGGPPPSASSANPTRLRPGPRDPAAD